MPKPKWLEPLEQAGHVGMGLLLSLVGAEIVYWIRERRWQWPPGNRVFILSQKTNRQVPFVPEDRVIDMMTDLEHCIIGSTIVNWLQKVAIAVLAYKAFWA